MLEALRQPLEDGMVTITRSRQTTTYPARFMLVAAMNPCPCGHRGSDRPCKCTPRTYEIYRQRLSGPLLDRIDMFVSVGRVEASHLLDDRDGTGSCAARARVEQARAFAAERFDEWSVASNAEIPSGKLLSACRLDEAAGHVLMRAANRFRLSARSVHRELRVARTIADLAPRDFVSSDDVHEALTFRLVERQEQP